LGNQILQEGSSSPADVFYTENTPVLEALREHGLLAPVAAATLAAVPSRYDSAQGDWVAVSARVSTLVYNTRQLTAAQLPSSILELAGPRWKGKVGFAPSETDFQPLLSAIVKLDGTATAERWLAGMQANGRIYPDNETVVTQVNNGESAVGPINHYYWYRLRDALGAALLRLGGRRRSPRLLRRGSAEVELQQECRAGLPRLPRQPQGTGSARAQSQLRVPAAAGRGPGEGPRATVLAAPGRADTSRARRRQRGARARAEARIAVGRPRMSMFAAAEQA